MSKLGASVVIAAAIWCAACTKPNPDLCCSSEADCEAQGIPADQMCTDGLVCRGNQCIAEPCTTGGDCDAAAPFCNAGGLCEPACDTNAACPGFGGDPADATCDASGLCVECETSMECTDASLPACVANTCVQCATSADCTAANLPACVANTCVQCATSSDCGSDTPVCDANACRACGSDAECASGVCESTGACAAAAAVIYIDTTGSDGGSCTQAAPCAHLSYAVTQLQATRNIISIAPGDYVDTKTMIPSTGTAASVEVRGHNSTLTEGVSTEITPLVGPMTTYFLASNITTTLEDLSVQSTLSTWTIDLNASSGVHSLVNVTVPDCNSGIILYGATTASQIRVASTTGECLVSNASLVIDRANLACAQADLVVLGTITATNVMAYDSKLLPPFYGQGATGSVAFSTFVNHYDAGGSNWADVFQCDGTSQLDVSDSVIWNAGSGSAASTVCVDFSNSITSDSGVVGTTNADPKFVDGSNHDYHLSADSPAIDQATTGPTTDFEGDRRPQGAAFDLGADEWMP